MGSITQAPKAPAQTSSPAVIYYTPSAPSYSGGDTGTTTDTPSPDTDAQKSQQREQNLLRRDRSRLGTVLTGFRGLLGLSDGTATPRKTLLGE